MQWAYVGGLKFRALGPRSLMIRGVTDPTETRLSARITVPKLEVIRQTVLIVYGRYGDAPEKWVPRISPFNSTQGHRNRHASIGYTFNLLLVTHSNHESV